jgi:hypothetical protein
VAGGNAADSLLPPPQADKAVSASKAVQGRHPVDFNRFSLPAGSIGLRYT